MDHLLALIDLRRALGSDILVVGVLRESLTLQSTWVLTESTVIDHRRLNRLIIIKDLPSHVKIRNTSRCQLEVFIRILKLLLF